MKSIITFFLKIKRSKIEIDDLNKVVQKLLLKITPLHISREKELTIKQKIIMAKKIFK